MANVVFETLYGTAASETLSAVIRCDAQVGAYDIQNVVYSYDGDNTLSADRYSSNVIGGQTYIWTNYLYGGDGDDTMSGGGDVSAATIIGVEHLPDRNPSDSVR